MVKQRAKNALVILAVALLLFAAMLLRVAAHGYSDSMAAPLLRNAIHIGLLLAWSISVRSRVMQPQALKLLMGISALMLFWFAVRLLKYEFVENPVLLRYLWYLYYLPMLFIPICALFTAMLLGKSELAHLPGYSGVLTGISAALFLLVMTNDLHQLVFRFPQGKPWSDSSYGYGPVYYAIALWLLVCGLSFLILLLSKCRIPQSRKFIWLPGVPVVLLLVYTVLYLLRISWLFAFFGDLPVAFCLCYAAVLESCMQTGLIQTNTGYDILFEAATIQAQITDTHWVTRYQSGASSLSPETLAKAEAAPVLLNPTTLLKTNRISGGHVAWQEDVTELADTLEQLEENQRELEDENFLEREALHAREEVLRLQEKNRLYDLIGTYTRPQVALLHTLLTEYSRAEGENSRRRLLEKSCVIGAYIKRCGNLLLIRESSASAPVSELIKAMEESLQNLELTETQCSLTSSVEEPLPTAVMVEAYACFENIVEALLGKLSCLFVNLRIKDGSLLLHMEAETEADLPFLAHSPDIRREDGVNMITFHYALGGEEP